MALLGADTDELREVGKEFEEGKEITDDVIKFVQALIIALKAASFFSGGASAAYAEYLETTVLPWLKKISEALGVFAQLLNGQAQQQDDTSSTSNLPGTAPQVGSNAPAPTSYTGAQNLPAPIQPFSGGSIVGGTGGTSSTGGTGGSTAPAGTSTPTTTTGATTTPGGSSLGTGTGSTAAGQTPTTPLQALQQLGQLANTLSHLGDPSSSATGTDASGTTAGTTPGTTAPGATATTPTGSDLGSSTGIGSPTGNGTGAPTSPFSVDPSNGHLMLDTGIDTNGPDQTTGTGTGTSTGLGTTGIGSTGIGSTGIGSTTPITGTGTDSGLSLGQPHFTVDPSNGHLMLDTGIDTNGPDQSTGTTGIGTGTISPVSTTPATPISSIAPGDNPHFGTHAIGADLGPNHSGGGGVSQPSNVGGPGPGHVSSGDPFSSSPAPTSAAPTAHGTGTDAPVHAGTPHQGTSFSPVSHAQALTSGGGSHAGAPMSVQPLGHSATPIGDAAAAQHSSYGAAAGIAGGAAVMGLGGAALAARGSGTSTGTGSGDGRIDSLAATNSRGSRGEDVKALQQRLTAAGYDTKGADGVWGRNTEAAYEAYRGDHPLPVQAGQGYTAPDGYDYTKIAGIKGNANVTPQFLRGVEAMSQRLGAKPEHILAAMSFETGGSFSPSIKNPHSSATGLIQFMDSTAKGMGTTTGDLARMSPTEQLPYVEKYFEPYRGRLGDLDRVYTTILAGHPATGDTPLFTQGDAHTGGAYHANAPLDANHNGVITADEAAAKPASRMH